MKKAVILFAIVLACCSCTVQLACKASYSHHLRVGNEVAGITLSFISIYTGVATQYLYNSKGDMIKARVLAISYGSNTIMVDTTLLQPGEYTVTIVTGSGEVVMPERKMLKQKYRRGTDDRRRTKGNRRQTIEDRQ